MFRIRNSMLVAFAAVAFSTNAFAASWFVTASGGVGANPVWVGTEGGKTVYVCQVGGTPYRLQQIPRGIGCLLLSFMEAISLLALSSNF